MEYDYQFGNTAYKYDSKYGVKFTKYKILAPEQEQDVQPGMEYLMHPLPIFDNPNYKNLLFSGNTGLRKNIYV